MTDTPTPGSPAWESQQNQGSALPPDAVVPTGNTSGDQPPQWPQEDHKHAETARNEDGSVNVAAEARKAAEGSGINLHRLEGDPVAKAEAFEEKRKSDLEEARELHNAARKGADVNKQ